MALCRAIIGCGFAAVEGERFCGRHDGRRPSTQLIWLCRGRECVIVATGAARAVVRFRDSGRLEQVGLASLVRPGAAGVRARAPHGEAQKELIGLLEGGPLSVTQVAHRRGVTFSAAHKTLARAERNGLVRRVRRGVYEAVAA